MITLKKAVAMGLALAGGVALSVSANAATFTGLYNTGVDNAGNVLAPTVAGVSDTHYTITAVSNNTWFGVAPITPKVTSFTPSWSANDAAGAPGSAWITPNLLPGFTRPATSGPLLPTANPNLYFYDLVFNIDFDPNSAKIVGDLQSDNYARILLNGVDIGGQAPVPSPGLGSYFKNFTAFGAASGFQAGNNTLTFVVYDYGVVTGLRVSNLVGSVVPEPATWAMMLSGFFVVAAQMRRRRKVSTVVA